MSTNITKVKMNYRELYLFEAVCRRCQDYLSDKEVLCAHVDLRFNVATKCLAWKVGGEKPYWLIVTTADALADKHGNRYQFSLRAPATESDLVPGWTIDMISQFLEALEHQPRRMSPALSCPQEGLKKLDGTPSKIASISFCRDADLGAFSCRDGAFEFVGLLGMTKDETEAMLALEPKMVLAFLWEQSTPHGLMDFERESHLNAETSRRLREEAAESGREFGTWHAAFEVEEKFGKIRITVPAASRGQFTEAFGCCIMLKEPMRVDNGTDVVTFAMGGEARRENGVVTIPVNMAEVSKVSKVLAGGGRHAPKKSGYAIQVK